MRSLPLERARDTKAVYAFDKHMAYGLPSLPIANLRALGEAIWRKHNRRKASCPVIVAGRGMKRQGVWFSYCEGRCRIVLARNERNRLILIHEMAHALTSWLHGKRFQNKYAELLGAWL